MASNKQQKVYTGFVIVNDHGVPIQHFHYQPNEPHAMDLVREELAAQYETGNLPEDTVIILFNETNGECKMLKVTPPQQVEFEEF